MELTGSLLAICLQWLGGTDRAPSSMATFASWRSSQPRTGSHVPPKRFSPSSVAICRALLATVQYLIGFYFVQQPLTASSLPPEIWDKIVKCACMDGGSTGCALSLVSHYIRDVSHSSRLQSIALDGLRALQSAALELDRRAPKARPVRFLYLSNTNATTDEETQSWHALCVKIVTLISPTVEVLTINFAYDWSKCDWLHSLRPHPKVHFPQLRSLTGCITSFFDIDGAFPSMPVLEHLYLFADLLRQDLVPEECLYLIHFRQAPCLTHLRLSNVYHNDGLLSSLGYVIGLPDHVARVNKKIAQEQQYRLRRPSAAEKINLEAEIIKTDTLAPSLRLRYLRLVIVHHLMSYMDVVDETIDGVKRLAATCQSYRAIDVMNFRVDWDNNSQRLRLAWEEVICGGLGMWDIRSDLEHRGRLDLFYRSGSFESQEMITSKDLPRLLSHSSVYRDL
jgi:hypothetical protein